MKTLFLKSLRKWTEILTGQPGSSITCANLPENPVWISEKSRLMRVIEKAFEFFIQQMKLREIETVWEL